MRTVRVLRGRVGVLALTLGSLTFMGGCGGGVETGTQVPVDMEKEAAQRKEMEQFYESTPPEKTGKRPAR